MPDSFTHLPNKLAKKNSVSITQFTDSKERDFITYFREQNDS